MHSFVSFGQQFSQSDADRELIALYLHAHENSHIPESHYENQPYRSPQECSFFPCDANLGCYGTRSRVEQIHRNTHVARQRSPIEFSYTRAVVRIPLTVRDARF